MTVVLKNVQKSAGAKPILDDLVVGIVVVVDVVVVVIIIVVVNVVFCFDLG